MKVGLADAGVLPDPPTPLPVPSLPHHLALSMVAIHTSALLHLRAECWQLMPVGYTLHQRSMRAGRLGVLASSPCSFSEVPWGVSSVAHSGHALINTFIGFPSFLISLPYSFIMFCRVMSKSPT